MSKLLTCLTENIINFLKIQEDVKLSWAVCWARGESHLEVEVKVKYISCTNK